MNLVVKTCRREEFVNISADVARAIRESGVTSGLVMVYCPHTTAGVTINEAADPDVKADIIEALSVMVPQGPFRHAEGNSPAHIKASLMGSSAMIAIDGGKPVLGTWQGVFFCEFDGPRTRTVHINIMAERT